MDPALANILCVALKKDAFKDAQMIQSCVVLMTHLYCIFSPNSYPHDLVVKRIKNLKTKSLYQKLYLNKDLVMALPYLGQIVFSVVHKNKLYIKRETTLIWFANCFQEYKCKISSFLTFKDWILFIVSSWQCL